MDFIKHDYVSLMDVLHEMGVHQFVVGEKKEVIKEVIGALLEPEKNQIDSQDSVIMPTQLSARRSTPAMSVSPRRTIAKVRRMACGGYM